MKSYILSHLYRCSPDLLSPARLVWAATGPSSAPGTGRPATGPSPAPAVAPTGPAGAPSSAPTIVENSDTIKFRKELTKLKNDLDSKGVGGSLMKFAEEHGDNMGDWQANPQSAIKFFEDYESSIIATPTTGASSDVDLAKSHKINIHNLIETLKNPTADAQKFNVAKEIILSIAESINRRKSEVAKAQDALGNLNENALNNKAKNVVENIYHTYERMSTVEKIAAVGAIAFFLKMAFSNDKGNTIFGPAIKWIAGGFAANIITQAVTGKSAIDHAAEFTGLGRFLPVSSDQLPDFMKALALKASADKGVKIDMPSELVAIGKLGSKKMSEFMAPGVYDPTGDSIDPVIFGLRPAKEGEPASGEITPKHLFMIVDTMVRKHKTQGAGRSALGDKKAFMMEYCDVGRHDFTFMETVSDLFQAESMKLVADSMSPEEWETYRKVVENDTRDMWSPANVMPDCKPLVRRYGTKMYGLTYLTTQYKSPDGNQYVYQIRDSGRISSKVTDSIDFRKQSADLLKEKAGTYLFEKIIANGTGTGLMARSPTSSHLRYVPSTTAGEGHWELDNVSPNAGGAAITVRFDEYGDGGDFKVTNKTNNKSAKLDSTFAAAGKAILD